MKYCRITHINMRAIRARIIYALTLAIIFSSLKTYADNRVIINFAVNSPGAPPYLYSNPKTEKYDGLIVDILTHMSLENDIDIEFVDSHRSRLETHIYEGVVDAMLSSTDWLAHPERLISTDKILDHHIYLYSTKKFKPDFNIKNVTQASICSRRAYVYQSMTQMVKDKKLIRVDSSDQLLMLGMLIKDRCDYAILNEHNAAAIISSDHFKQSSFYRSPKPTDSTLIRIFLRPQFNHVKAAINRTITIMQENGQIQQSINKHNVYNEMYKNR